MLMWNFLTKHIIHIFKTRAKECGGGGSRAFVGEKDNMKGQDHLGAMPRKNLS